MCFPLEGNAFVGDRFGGDRVTATAPADDGTVIFQIGSDREATLPLSEGGAFRGQHRIEIAEE